MKKAILSLLALAFIGTGSAQAQFFKKLDKALNKVEKALDKVDKALNGEQAGQGEAKATQTQAQIGRASCRERV